MATITTRSGKGSPLTNTEVDANFTNLNSDKVELADLSVSTVSASGGGSLSYSNTTGVFSFAPSDTSNFLSTTAIGTSVLAYDANLQSFVSAFTLPTADGSNGQVLTTDGAGGLSFTTPAAGYDNSDVDAHLNQSTAATNEVLSWNGSDYDWVAQSTGSVDYINSASFDTGTGVLSLTGEGNAGASVDLDGRYELAGGSSGIANVVEDTTPQLGGNLDLNNFIIGNTQAQVSARTTTIQGGLTSDEGYATGGKVVVESPLPTSGVMSNTRGDVQIKGYQIDIEARDLKLTNDFTTVGGRIKFQEATTNGSNYVSLRAPNSISTTYALYLPAADGTNGQALTTDGSGNLSFTDVSGGGGISDVVEDTTPQLGGDLDLNGNAIRDANIYFGDDLGNAPHSYFDANGKLHLGSVTYPTADGTNGQVLTTDGSGNLSFTTASGGISNVIEDTTPELGGNLDIRFNYVGKPNSNFSIQDFGSGATFTVSMFSQDMMRVYASSDFSNNEVKIFGDVDVRNFGNLKFNSVTSKVERHISGGVIESYDRYSSSQSSLSVSVQDNSTSNVQWIAAALTSNVTLNITGITNSYNIPTSVNTISVMANVGSTGYIVNAVNVDGSSQTINWAGGSAPTPTTNAYNLFTFTIFWNSSASDIEVFGTHQGF